MTWETGKRSFASTAQRAGAKRPQADLRDTGAAFRLVYRAHSAEAAAFVDLLTVPEFADRTVIHYDEGDPARALDLAVHLADHPPDANCIAVGRAA